MANSHAQLGISEQHRARLQGVQTEIDSFVQNERDIAFEEQQYGNSYDVDLDSAGPFVLGEDIHTARIFPMKRVDTVRTKYRDTTIKIDSYLILVAKKVLELVLLAGNLLVVFLIKFDLFCEKVLTKGSVYVERSASDVSRNKELLKEERSRAEVRKPESELVNVHTVHKVQSAGTQAYEEPRREVLQKPAPSVYVPEPSPVYTQAQASKAPSCSEEDDRTVTVFFYALSILYRELLFRKKN